MGSIDSLYTDELEVEIIVNPKVSAKFQSL